MTRKLRPFPPFGAREIPGFEGLYWATLDGRIWSDWSTRILKSAVRRDGYHYVMLRKDGLSLNRAVHRLVCAAFHGEPAPLMEVNHDDLVKTNNLPGNLEWMTPKQNSQHARARLPREKIAAMDASRARARAELNKEKRGLSIEVARAIRRELAAGTRQCDIVEQLGLARHFVSSIACKNTYRECLP